MDKNVRILDKKDWPLQILEIPEPPKRLFIEGKLPPLEYKWLCIVGSRKNTSYGRDVCERLIEGLAGYPIVIVSGLAYGIDSIAHKKALEVGLPCVAIPGSGLNRDVLYPRGNSHLAEQIRKSGCLLSEYNLNQKSAPWTFPRRNRIMAGLCCAVLVIEASKKSGTLITSRLALDYNRDVFTVPSPIFNLNSFGPNNLLKQGATPITCSEDILREFGLEEKELKFNRNDFNDEEFMILSILKEPMSFDKLVEETKLESSKVQEVISILELKGFIKKEGGIVRLIR